MGVTKKNMKRQFVLLLSICGNDFGSDDDNLVNIKS